MQLQQEYKVLAIYMCVGEFDLFLFFFYYTGSLHSQNGSRRFKCVPIISSTLLRLTMTFLY